MGDRAQIAVKQINNGFVYLYTHWNGSEINSILKHALIRGEKRWDDPEYLTRIIFCEMVKGSLMDETGYGIGNELHGDTEHPVPILDCENQTITFENCYREMKPTTFKKFTGG